MVGFIGSLDFHKAFPVVMNKGSSSNKDRIRKKSQSKKSRKMTKLFEEITKRKELQALLVLLAFP